MAAQSEDVKAGSKSASRRFRVRWPFIAAGILAVVVALGAYGWFERVPAYRPSLQGSERLGIDVSSHQGAIDWRRVAGDDIRFTYIKATEGGDFVDDHFAANWRGAEDAGLERGAYHFFTLCRPGADQADNFLRTVPNSGSALPPAVDLEFVGNCAGRPSREDLLRELKSFVDRVESAMGKRVVLYVLDDFEDQYHVRQALDRPSWVRSILHRPDNNDWLFWQVNFETRVDGIDGGVDLNVMRAS